MKGNEKMKKSIKVMLAGMFMVPMMALSLSVAQPAFAACDVNGGAAGGSECAKGSNTPTNLFGEGSVFKNITNAALFLVGAISVLMLIYGGIRYTISGGESANVTAAKNTILYAIVGIIVSIMAYAIVNFVITSLPTN